MTSAPAPPSSPVMTTQTMCRFGPANPVSLSDIRQAGCTGVVTALHDMPSGEIWTSDAIRERLRIVERAGLR